MGKIGLYLQEFYLGQLFMSGDEYIFEPNLNDILLAKSKFPLAMKCFDLDSEKSKQSSDLPQIFLNFNNYTYRQDIIEKTGILESDDMFVRLYKLASLEMMTGNFILKQE